MKSQKFKLSVLIVALAAILFSCSKNDVAIDEPNNVVENEIKSGDLFRFGDLLKYGITFVDENTANLEAPTDEMLLNLFHEGIGDFLVKEYEWEFERVILLREEVEQVQHLLMAKDFEGIEISIALKNAFYELIEYFSETGFDGINNISLSPSSFANYELLTRDERVLFEAALTSSVEGLEVISEFMKLRSFWATLACNLAAGGVSTIYGFVAVGAIAGPPGVAAGIVVGIVTGAIISTVAC